MKQVPADSEVTHFYCKETLVQMWSAWRVIRRKINSTLEVHKKLKNKPDAFWKEVQ